MSFARISLRRTLPVARNPRTYVTKKQLKQNEKEMDNSAGDSLKKAGQAFKADGTIGKEFNADGSVGGAAQAVGGPFSADGVIGKQFTKDGAIGGTGQAAAENVEQTGKEMKK